MDRSRVIPAGRPDATDAMSVLKRILVLVVLPPLAVACGATSGDALYSPVERVRGNGGAGPGDTSGGAPSFGTGGFIAESGGAASGGAEPGSGGAGPGSGGTGPGSGGADFGGASGTGGAGGGPLGCDFTGTWATYISQPVTWPATPFILLAGSGSLQQWNLVEERQEGPDIHVDTLPCSIYLPDLQADVLGAYAKFGIRFPDNLFDEGDIQKTAFVLKTQATASGVSFTTDPFAIVIGATLADPVTATWPAGSNGGLTLRDDDRDGKVGITVIPATGQGYSYPPTDLSGNSADLIYIAERTISSLSGTITSCDEVNGAVTIVSAGTKPGIDSSVVGCRKVGGAECVLADASFIDVNRPQYTPAGLGTMKSVRMPKGSTCADVRARFPKQSQ